MISKKLYIFNSRIVTHISFWVLYYLLFSFIWASNKDYLASFFLEFVLLPIRVMAVYFTIYFYCLIISYKRNTFGFLWAIWY